ncbi:dispanin subfamily A member 2b-like [Channa argus]|uniref:dispanin subfamily A member 2b-like n=1 Tax=Channa argus TaxID=215402 RepID=UPI0035212E52
MNPAQHSAQAVPLQLGRSDGTARQPQRFTAVKLTTDTAKDHIIWSLCCFVYTNPFCFGLAALIYSIRARDRKVAGDLDGARRYGSTARCLNIWATVLASIIICIIVIVLIVVANQSYGGYSFYH